jgi:acyl-CoA synthetase (AMP-forming)/AMP-acid ligase II
MTAGAGLKEECGRWAGSRAGTGPFPPPNSTTARAARRRVRWHRLYLRNDIAYFEAVFGAGMLGIYPVPVNWHYTPDEAHYLLTDSGVKLLLIHADLL